MLKPVSHALPNTFEFETSALVHPSGFREYDARWWFGHPGSDKAPELNLIGVQALGMGLGTLIQRLRGVGRTSWWAMTSAAIRWPSRWR